MQVFDDPEQVIQVATDQTFSIAVPGNPTSGYLWGAQIDGRYLEALGQEVQPGSKAIGAGGHENLHFRALEAGETEILLENRRPWEQEPRDSRRFQVKIT